MRKVWLGAPLRIDQEVQKIEARNTREPLRRGVQGPA